MGQEIPTNLFTPEDFEAFQERLGQETRLLGEWFEQKKFRAEGCIAGFELEAWLIDRKGIPSPINEAFLERMHSEMVTPELSRFNIELNTEPLRLTGHVLPEMDLDLNKNWNQCVKVADSFDADLVMIGILPSLQETDLTMENMSKMKRYLALNQQVFAMRKGLPLQLDILGEDHLKTTHYNVMLESSTTSFQVHLQVNPEDIVRFYNASLIVSAATLGAAVNSPYLFGHELWDETRIPLFEQAVEVGGFKGAVFGPTRRVSFGTSYIKESLFECFVENHEHFPVMLPIRLDSPLEKMDALRLHNGTIWRWNRPLIGFTDSGEPTLRLEHRVIPGGPTVVDMIANAAFYYGLVYYMATMEEPPEQQIPFAVARDNFYHAAKKSLHAQVQWLDDRRINLRNLILSELVPMAKVGLQMLGLDKEDINKYIGIINDRVERAQTGAEWQKDFVAKHGKDMVALTQAYLEQQQTGKPVHTWPV